MNAQTERRVWIGCLACYNDGRLVGDWFPAIEAGEVTSRQLHIHAGTNWDVVDAAQGYGPHEELWVMDHEGLPITGECSPAEAQAIAEVCDAIEADGYPVDAVKAWAENTGEGFPTEWDDVSADFEDAYAGSWESFKDYAYEVADEMIGARGDVDDLFTRYFDHEAFARDLAFDYFTARWVIDTPDRYESGVYVFRSL